MGGKFNRMLKVLASGLGLFALTACGGGSFDTPDLALTYNRAASSKTPDRNPVIVIPGLLGSKLIDEPTQTKVWGAFVGGAADPQDPEGLTLISLPWTYLDNSQSEFDQVVEDGALEEVKVEILGIPISLKAYAQILQALGAGGYRDQQVGLKNPIIYDDAHFTCFQFSYDWRKSNAENAARLFRYVQDVREYVALEYKNRFGIEDADIKVDIVAHSMGGLLTRYMLRYGDQPLSENGNLPDLTWEGAAHVERAILIGTPSAGAVDAFIDIEKGKDYGRPFLPYYSPALLASFPSIYELMPRDRHHALVMSNGEPMPSLYDINTWERFGWGPFDPDVDDDLAVLLGEAPTREDRLDVVRHTMRHHLATAKRFQAALDVPATPPQSLLLNLVLGDVYPTNRELMVEAATGNWSVTQTSPGDTVVLRTSALMDEREDGNEGIWTPRLRGPVDWDGVMILPFEHVELTQSEIFIDNLLYWLLVEPRRSDNELIGRLQN